MVDGDLAIMLDADLPVRRFGNATESAVIDDEPSISTGRTGTFDFLRSRTFRLDQPVDIFRTEALGIVDVELTSLRPLGSSQ